MALCATHAHSVAVSADRRGRFFKSCQRVFNTANFTSFTRKLTRPAQRLVAVCSNSPSQQPPKDKPRDIIDLELDFHEQHADITVAELLTMQDDMPNDQELQDEIAKMLGEHGAAGEDEAEEEEEALDANAQGPQYVSPKAGRKGQILMELLTAPSEAELDNRIAQFSEEIDDELLGMLQRRADVVALVRGAQPCTTTTTTYAPMFVLDNSAETRVGVTTATTTQSGTCVTRPPPHTHTHGSAPLLPPVCAGG